MESILEIQGLQIGIERRDSAVDGAVRGVSLQVGAGEVYGLVGESGCGKTLTALAVAGLLPAGVRVTGGTIRFENTDLASLSPASRRKLNGQRIGMVFQEPLTALNPLRRIGEQVEEPLRIHNRTDRRNRKSQVYGILHRAGLQNPERLCSLYPHQLSGGMLQRVVISIALILQPALLIADEPTTALDVTTQTQILHLLRQMCRDSHTAMLFISHDMDVVNRLCDRVGILYAGRIVEQGSVRQVLDNPLHPYTNGLMTSIPGVLGGRRLFAMPGNVPSIEENIPGCPFALRCPHVMPRCHHTFPESSLQPDLNDPGVEHTVFCHLFTRGDPA
ncbi:MAG: ABC transporter ATP-binding protein [Clostridia bacterium]|nr:ABC transporter ATP-binding protein [Clostridia bacterium]